MRSRTAGLAVRTAGTIAVLLLAGAGLPSAALALVAHSSEVTSFFSPNRLGAPANLSTRAVFASGGSVPTPIGRIRAWGPAGLAIDVADMDTCSRHRLESHGPAGCPADSRIGFGGGVGLEEVAREIIKEPYTLDFFLGSREDGRLTFLVYVRGRSPVQIELVVVAREINGPKPYGWGVEIDLPPLPTLPGASYASIETSYFTVGSQHVAYYRTVHGRRRLVHIKGLIVPRHCPRGGFPFRVSVAYLDGTSSADAYTAPCPAT